MSKAESKKSKLFSYFVIGLLLASIASAFIIPEASANTTIGDTTATNASYFGLSRNVQYFFGPYTASANGVLDKLYFYLSSATPFSIKGALYTDNSNTPNSLIAVTSEGTFSAASYTWCSISFNQNGNVVAGSSYWISLEVSIDSNTVIGNAVPGASKYALVNGVGYNDFPSTAGALTVSSDAQISTYATVFSDPFSASNISASLILGSNSSYSAQWNTNETLSKWVIQTNQTGTPVNSTWQSFGASTWSNYTGANLGNNVSDVGNVIEWQIWANTTLGFYATTGLQYDTIEPGTYYYVFNGVYDEVTNEYLGPLNITVYFDNGETPFTFVLNGTYRYAPSSQPYYFQYPIQPYANTTDTTIDRQYWLKPNENTGTYNIYGNNIGLVHIIFQIRALGGIGLSSFLEVQRIINGTYQTVDMRQVDATGIATMSLQPYTTYRVVAYSGSSSTTFGNINTYTTQITLTISALSFPNDVLMQYKYLRIWASRPSGTEIQISYEDTNLQTDSVSYQLAFANGTVAYSATHTGENSFIDVWSAADPDTTYYLTANVSQSTFGYSTFAQVLLRDGASTSPIDLSFLGDWPIDPTQILWAFIVFIMFGVGTVLNAYIGGFAGVATAAILVWLGWLQVPSGGIVAAFCVVCMVGIVYWKRRS